MKFVAILILFSTNIFAGTAPTLDQLSQNDVNAISKEFAANFTHTILAPASSLGKIWGFEFGLMGGITKTPEIDRVSKIYSPTSSISAIPTAGLIAGVTIPFGINAEVNMIPKVTASDSSLKNASYAIKWEITHFMPNMPLNIALRAHANSGEFSYTSVVNNATTGNQNVNAKATWKNSSSGYNLEISKKLFFIEPYIGFGLVNATTDIGVTGSSNISIFTFSTASSYQAKNSGTHFFTGLNLNLFLLKIGAEYNQIMGKKKMVAKLSFYF